MLWIKQGLRVMVLAFAGLGLISCTHVKAWTAPTWIYTNAQDKLELLNSNAARHFCLTREAKTVCGEYSDNGYIFSTAMARFKKAQREVPQPKQPSRVEFKTAEGDTWTWALQPDGSFRDDKNEVWPLKEFRQFGRIYSD